MEIELTGYLEKGGTRLEVRSQKRKRGLFFSEGGDGIHQPSNPRKYSMQNAECIISGWTQPSQGLAGADSSALYNTVQNYHADDDHWLEMELLLFFGIFFLFSLVRFEDRKGEKIKDRRKRQSSTGTHGE